MVIPSSDAETDRMEELEGMESELEQLSSAKSEVDTPTDDLKRPIEAEQEEEEDGEKRSAKRAKSEAEEEDLEADPEGDDEDAGEDEDQGGDVDNDNDNDNDNNDDEEFTKREEQRVKAMNSLKSIEIKFAQLKDKLYNTQLQKLEFELKLCEENEHFELIEYLKMVDEDFQKKQQRLLNEQKYKLKSLDIQTRASRTQIHQQFMKQCQDLKSKEILDITTDWYDINRERRSMDLMSLELPEYYQYFGYLQSGNVDHYLPDLINLRNGQLNEIGELQSLVKFKMGVPSGLNYLKGCTKEELEGDLNGIGL